MVGAEHCVVVYLTHRYYTRPTVVIFVAHTWQVGMLVRARGVHFVRGVHFARGMHFEMHFVRGVHFARGIKTSQT